MYYSLLLPYSLIAQSVERLAVNQKVVGSSPTQGVLLLGYRQTVRPWNLTPVFACSNHAIPVSLYYINII